MFELNKIEKVIFIKDKNKAYIFYSDGTLKNASVDEGKKAATYMANKAKLEKEDITNWDKIEFCLFEDFENKYKSEIYMRENKTRFELNKKSEEEKRRKQRRIRESKQPGTAYRVTSILVSLGLLASTAALGGGCYFLYNKFFNNNSQSDEANKDIEDTNADIKAPNEISSIINDNDLNSTKRNFVSFLYEYIQNYNSVFANKHIDNKTSTKPAITVDEVISQLLIYKNYDKKQLFEIFGYDDFTSEDMYNNYMSAVEYETKAHIIQKESLNKNFIKGKKKDIYDKYESMMINYNIQNTQERKIEVAKQFWSEVRQDIDIENADKLPKNMEVILPIMKAMQKVCKNLDIDEKLNSKEFDWYFTECDQRIREKLYNYDVKLGDVATVNKRLGATVVISFNQIKDIIISQLTNDGIYSIEDHERDISDHKEYKDAIKYFKKEKKDNNTKTASNDDSNDYDNDDSNNNQYNNEDDEDYKENKTSKKSKKRKTKSNDQQDQSEPSDNDSLNDNSDDDSYDDTNNDTNTNDDEDANEDSYNEDYTDQEEPENKSDNSEYPDYIKDITDDETGAYADFPSLNNVNKKMTKSQYADYIISNMETEKKVSTPKINVKRIQINYK